MSERRALLPLVLLLGLLTGLLALPVLAQDSLPLPVDPSGNTLGEVVVSGQPVRFVVASTGAEAVQAQVFAISAGFGPRLRILDPSGTPLVDLANPGMNTVVGGTAFLPVAGAYTIEVAGEQGSTGQFMLNLQPATNLPPPVELVPGQQVSGIVGAESPILIYEFSTTDAAALTLQILSQLANIGPAYSVSDATGERTIATSDGTLLGATHFLTASNGRYRVEVQVGSAGTDVPFTICLGCTSEASGSVGPATTPEAVAALCSVRSSVGGPVNVRSGPGTQYLIIGTLLPDQTFPVTAQIAGGSWYQIDYNGQPAWVGASVTALEGDCGAIPNVPPPANAPLAPALPTATLPPAATSTSEGPTPTATATTDGGATATATATATPSDSPTATATMTSTDTVPPPVETEEP